MSANSNGMSATYAKNDRTSSALDRALEGQSDSFKRKVLEIVQKSELPSDDPIFLMLIATGRLEVMLEEAPEALNRLFKNWNTEMTRAFELVDHALIERQKLAIANAAGDLIRTAEREEARRFFGSLMPAGAVLLSMLGLGFVMGVTVPPYLGGGYVQNMKITAAQAETLQWAESKEGKFAQNLMRWNRGYLDNRECEKDVKRLNVKLLLDGRPVKEGFCTIWIIPPEQRKYGE